MPVDRWGGNATETYNWQLGSQNLGSDWYFENASDCWCRRYNYCSGMSKNTVFAFGNEPSLWSSTHRDVHPQPETAAELWSKSMRVATLVKQEDPSAQVLGFSEWGWPGYFCSGADTPGNGCGPTGCTTSPDRANHGHIPMAAVGPEAVRVIRPENARPSPRLF